MSPLQSPPVSQGDEDMVMLDSPTSNTIVEKPDAPITQRPSISNGNSSPSSSTRTISASTSQGAPGSSWQTKKFQEEYDRSMSQILDQKWNMSSYPDPLLRK